MRTLVLVGPDYTLHSPEYIRVADLQNTIFFHIAVKGHRPLKGSYTASLQPLKKAHISAVDISAEVSLRSCT